jgi:hypothetical protein
MLQQYLMAPIRFHVACLCGERFGLLRAMPQQHHTWIDMLQQHLSTRELRCFNSSSWLPSASRWHASVGSVTGCCVLCFSSITLGSACFRRSAESHQTHLTDLSRSPLLSSPLLSVLCSAESATTAAVRCCFFFCSLLSAKYKRAVVFPSIYVCFLGCLPNLSGGCVSIFR